MYRDDREAMVARLDALARVEQQNDALKREPLQLRRAVASQSIVADPYMNPYALGPAERQLLGTHQLDAFPVWAAGLLHLVTLGLFSIVFYGIQQGRLPRASKSDPTTGQAIGYWFIPFFNLYWTFLSPLRLCDRITLQYRLRGRAEEAPRGMVLASAISSMIPYIGPFFAILVLWPIAVCLMQHRINRLVELGPLELEPSLPEPLPQLTGA